MGTHILSSVKGGTSQVSDRRLVTQQHSQPVRHTERVRSDTKRKPATRGHLLAAGIRGQVRSTKVSKRAMRTQNMKSGHWKQAIKERLT